MEVVKLHINFTLSVSHIFYEPIYYQKKILDRIRTREVTGLITSIIQNSCQSPALSFLIPIFSLSCSLAFKLYVHTCTLFHIWIRYYRLDYTYEREHSVIPFWDCMALITSIYYKSINFPANF